MPKKLIAAITAEINATIVMHPAFKKAFDGILKLIHLNSLSEVPFGGSVIAPPGCGKSSLIKCIKQHFPDSSLFQEGSSCLSVSAEANTNIGHLVSKLMKQLGYQTIVRASTLYEQSALLAEALKERKVIAVFIDESQHISRGKRTLSAAAITDWIKQLSDASGVVIIMLGTRDFIPLSQSNDQLSSRAPAAFSMSEFQCDEIWQGLLKQFAEAVKSFDLTPTYKKFSKKLHKATAGTPRTLKQLLIASSIAGLQAGKKVLDQESLKHGYDQVFGNNPQIGNMFNDE